MSDSGADEFINLYNQVEQILTSKSSKENSLIASTIGRMTEMIIYSDQKSDDTLFEISCEINYLSWLVNILHK